MKQAKRERKFGKGSFACRRCGRHDRGSKGFRI